MYWFLCSVFRSFVRSLFMGSFVIDVCLPLCAVFLYLVLIYVVRSSVFVFFFR